MPRFVILEHDHPHLHWDLMLEAGAVLRTWRLALPPRAGQDVPAEPLGDHRPLYLDYEGPVSGGRGQVRRWDWGTYSGTLPDAKRASEPVELSFHGQRLKGRAVLICPVSALGSFHLAAAESESED